jgi:hypothetical protein
MSSLVLDTGRRLLDAQPFDTRSATVGLVAIVLLAILLIATELLRGFGGARARAVIAGLSIAIGPLLFAFALIVGVRFGHLL